MAFDLRLVDAFYVGMASAPSHILCVETDTTLSDSRCAVLKQAGYFVDSALPLLAETLLSHRKFDLVVTSNLAEFELNRIINVMDGAEILVLEGFIGPAELTWRVDERLRRTESFGT